jgi:hypothetical protein
VPYVNAAATVLYQYPPVYGGPHVMYPSMAVLQPATALLQAPGSQPNIPVAATCKQESKVGKQCLNVYVLFNVTRLALRYPICSVLYCYHLPLHRATTTVVQMTSPVPEIMDTPCISSSRTAQKTLLPAVLPLLCVYISY